MERVVESVPADRALGFELLDLWFTHPLITYREPEPHGDALKSSAWEGKGDSFLFLDHHEGKSSGFPLSWALVFFLKGWHLLAHRSCLPYLPLAAYTFSFLS